MDKYRLLAHKEEFAKIISKAPVMKISGEHISEDANLTVRHISQKPNHGFLSIGLASDKPFSEQLFELLRQALKRKRFASK